MPNKGTIKPQLGFLGFGLTGYIALGAIAAIALASATAYIYKSRYESVKQEYAYFVAEVRAKGEAAKVKADAENKLNQQRKEKADREYKKLLAANTALNKRLRDNAGRGSMSGNEAATRIAENACIPGRTVNESVSRFTERLEDFTGRAAELVIKGRSSIDELNNAKRWAQETPGRDYILDKPSFRPQNGYTLRR